MYPPAAGGILTSTGKLPLPCDLDNFFFEMREQRLIFCKQTRIEDGYRLKERKIAISLWKSFVWKMDPCRNSRQFEIYMYRILKMFFFAKQSIVFFFFFKFKFGTINFDGKI